MANNLSYNFNIHFVFTIPDSNCISYSEDFNLNEHSSASDSIIFPIIRIKYILESDQISFKIKILDLPGGSFPYSMLITICPLNTKKQTSSCGFNLEFSSEFESRTLRFSTLYSTLIKQLTNCLPCQPLSFEICIFPQKSSKSLKTKSELPIKFLNSKNSLNTQQPKKDISEQNSSYLSESSQEPFQKMPGIIPPPIVPLTPEKTHSHPSKFTFFSDQSSDDVDIIEINQKDSMLQTTPYNGLINQGATCYMNSFLQSLYHLPLFREIIYSIPTSLSHNSQSTINMKVINSLQEIFWRLQFLKEAVSTRGFTHSLGMSLIEISIQQDIAEFSNFLFDKLSNELSSLPNDYLNNEIKNKISRLIPNLDSSNLQKSITNILFCGRVKRILEIPNLNRTVCNEEDFFNISLRVTGFKTLEESLKDLISIEKLDKDNLYKTDQGMQEANLSLKFSFLPPVLHFHLKRFDFSSETHQYSKVNDEFRFPRVADFGSILHISSDIYELSGVLIHKGSAKLGHYWAYLRPTPEEKWYKFNDSTVSETTIENVLDDGFGSLNNIHSAYMLIYVRQSAIPILFPKDIVVPSFIEKSIFSKKKMNESNSHFSIPDRDLSELTDTGDSLGSNKSQDSQKSLKKSDKLEKTKENNLCTKISDTKNTSNSLGSKKSQSSQKSTKKSGKFENHKENDLYSIISDTEDTSDSLGSDKNQSDYLEKRKEDNSYQIISENLVEKVRFNCVLTISTIRKLALKNNSTSITFGIPELDDETYNEIIVPKNMEMNEFFEKYSLISEYGDKFCCFSYEISRSSADHQPEIHKMTRKKFMTIDSYLHSSYVQYTPDRSVNLLFLKKEGNHSYFFIFLYFFFPENSYPFYLYSSIFFYNEKAQLIDIRHQLPFIKAKSEYDFTSSYEAFIYKNSKLYSISWERSCTVDFPLGSSIILSLRKDRPSLMEHKFEEALKQKIAQQSRVSPKFQTYFEVFPELAPKNPREYFLESQKLASIYVRNIQQIKYMTLNIPHSLNISELQKFIIKAYHSSFDNKKLFFFIESFGSNAIPIDSTNPMTIKDLVNKSQLLNPKIIFVLRPLNTLPTDIKLINVILDHEKILICISTTNTTYANILEKIKRFLDKNKLDFDLTKISIFAHKYDNLYPVKSIDIWDMSVKNVIITSDLKRPRLQLRVINSNDPPEVFGFPSKGSVFNLQKDIYSSLTKLRRKKLSFYIFIDGDRIRIDQDNVIPNEIEDMTIIEVE